MKSNQYCMNSMLWCMIESDRCEGSNLLKELYIINVIS